MSLFNTLENSTLDEMLGSSATLIGDPVTIGISSTEPNDDGTGITEPVGNGYVRVSVVNSDANFPAAASGIKKNGTIIAFPTAVGGDWILASHWVLWDGATPMLWGVLDDGAGVPTTREILEGDLFRFLVLLVSER